MTVEDILGLEKYGVFAVAANTISIFPLPGVTDIIREKRRLAGALCELIGRLELLINLRYRSKLSLDGS